MTPSSVLSAKACNTNRSAGGRARYNQLFKLFRGTKPPLSSVLSRARRSGFPGTRFISIACTTEPTQCPRLCALTVRGVRRSRRPFVTPVTVQ
jgi:hypothetical protein